MTDLLLPPWIGAARTSIRYVDSTGISRGEFSGAIKTGSKGGDRLSASLEFTPSVTSNSDSAMQRAALQAFLMRLRGRQNRAYLFDRGNRLRGSFPAVELFTNNTFENETTGWSVIGGSISVQDRVLKISASSGGSQPQIYQVISLTQYAPFVLRSFVMDGQESSGLNCGPYLDGGAPISGYSTARGFRLVSAVAIDSSTHGQYPLVFSSTSGYTAGMSMLVPWCSLSRCALVDNGPNLLLQSDELDTSWSTSNASVDDQFTTAPDGTNTADAIIEDGTTNAHFINQVVSVSASAADYSFSVALQSSGRNFAVLQLTENTGGHLGRVWFDLASGLVGTSGTTGANISNVRAFTKSLGSAWTLCTIVVRKTNAATSLTAFIAMASADNVVSYAGDGTSKILAWRATLAQSSVPTRLAQTTSAAIPGSNQTGSAIYIKGLPVNTNSLLLPGDQFEVITSRGSELKFVTASLSSDAAGLGYLQFEPPLRGVPADNAPIIILNPMGRFVFTGELAGWENEPGIVTRASAEFEEA